MNEIESAIVGAVSLEAPWALVESFSTYKREHPDDVNRGMEEVKERLAKHGVSVTMHQPELYLSLPGKARVEADGKTFRAKPPAYCVDARNGLSGELVYVPSNQPKAISTMFERSVEDASELAALLADHQGSST